MKASMMEFTEEEDPIPAVDLHDWFLDKEPPLTLIHKDMLFLMVTDTQRCII